LREGLSGPSRAWNESSQAVASPPRLFRFEVIVPFRVLPTSNVVDVLGYLRPI
jgi:hypothetical protein